MRKILITLGMAIITLNAFAQFEGTFGMGGHAKYNAIENDVGAGIHLHYYASNNLRVAPAFTYYYPQKKHQHWEAEANLHYIVPVSVTASLYPLAGVSYALRELPKEGNIEGEHLTHQSKQWGANIGVGIQHDIRYRVRANFELSYQFVKDFSHIAFMAGIGFWF